MLQNATACIYTYIRVYNYMFHDSFNLNLCFCEFKVVRGAVGRQLSRCVSACTPCKPQLKDHSLPAVSDCLLSTFASIIHIYSSLRLRTRTCHVVVTCDPLNMVLTTAYTTRSEIAYDRFPARWFIKKKEDFFVCCDVLSN